MKTLLCRGTRVSLKLEDGSSLSFEGAAMHDATGRAWPKCSVLIGPFPREGARQATEEEMKGAPRQYLGRTYRGKVSQPFDLPPRGLAAWTKVAVVTHATIFYTRGGTKYPGRYRHTMNKGRWIIDLVKGEGRATLWRHGRYHRIDLPKGCMLDDRGFVWP